jgi:hypothetical protein
MMKFSSEKLAELIEKLPKSDYQGLGSFLNEPYSDGFMYLYHNMFLEFLKKPNTEFTLDIDLFELDDLWDLREHCRKVEGTVSRTGLIMRRFVRCQPKAKAVQFV